MKRMTSLQEPFVQLMARDEDTLVRRTDDRARVAFWDEFTATGIAWHENGPRAVLTRPEEPPGTGASGGRRRPRQLRPTYSTLGGPNATTLEH